MVLLSSRLRRLLTVGILVVGLVAATKAVAPEILSSALVLLLGAPLDDPLDGAVMPPGFWHRAPEAASPGGDQSPEERARLLSLPYLGGRAPAPDGEATGVVFFDPETTTPGFNLYASGHGPVVLLTDLRGRPVHRWELAFEEAFPGVAPTSDTEFVRRARLLSGGRIVALYQTGGIAFLDRRSRIVGRCPGNFYNDFWLGEGRIWTIGKEVAASSHAGERLDDFLVLLEVGEDGEGCREVRRLSITRLLQESEHATVLAAMGASGDVLHTNAVEELDGSLAELSPLFGEGNLLISIREIDVIAIVDPEREELLWAQQGPWRRQHDPTLLDSGEILLFDNEGGSGGDSRLVRVEPETGAIVWSWPVDPGTPFSSPVAGAVERLPGGHLLVTESVPGRAFELTPEGRVVWEWRTPHRAGKENELVAMLFEVQRLPAAKLRRNGLSTSD